MLAVMRREGLWSYVVIVAVALRLVSVGKSLCCNVRIKDDVRILIVPPR